MKQNQEIEDTISTKLTASDEGICRFTKAEIGLSVHFGLYSLNTEGDEWIYFFEQIPFQTYRKRMDRFNPERFDAEEWADLMVEAGMKCLLITAKHHDGFCLWDSALTDFKVTNTAFKRDIIAELSIALRERGLDLHFFYSLVDWTHPDYRENWPAYIGYYQEQIRELCTGFGPIGGILLDGYWPRTKFEDEKQREYNAARGSWDLAGTYDLIHELQPDAVLANNTRILPLQGEDYQIWELDLPGENTTGFGCTEVGDKPTACWWNLNEGWSYQPWNHRVKSAEKILATYRAVRSRDAVFLLNVGPRRFGDIHPEEQQVLRRLGQMIHRNHV